MTWCPVETLLHMTAAQPHLNMPISHPLFLFSSHTLTFYCTPLSYIHINTHMRTHTRIGWQTIALRQERGVDYYFIALHWQRVDLFPSIPRWRMCRLRAGQRPDRLLMVFLLDMQSSRLLWLAVSCNGEIVHKVRLSFISSLHHKHSNSPTLKSKKARINYTQHFSTMWTVITVLSCALP